MRTALIVDDSAVIRKVARRIMETLDMTVHDAEDGAKGLTLCAQAMPDVILLDAFMPGMDGYAFLKALRSTFEGHRPKVLFCITENDVGTIARALRGGADAYLLKPFDRDDLIEKLAELGPARPADAA